MRKTKVLILIVEHDPILSAVPNFKSEIIRIFNLPLEDAIDRKTLFKINLEFRSPPDISFI